LPGIKIPPFGGENTEVPPNTFVPVQITESFTKNNHMKKQITLIFALALNGIVLAQMPTITQLKDINPSGASSGGARNFTVCNGKLYFVADNGTTGGELWVTNGTAAGTTLVKDINPGSAGSYPTYLVAMNNKIYFNAYNATYGNELWVSDGTSAGTVLLKDIQVGSNDSYPTELTVMNNLIIFQANDGIHAIEPWITDGTAVGTVLLKDINTDVGYENSNAQDFTVYNNKIYFRAEELQHGDELWVTDGTTTGTVLLKDINTGSPTWGGSPMFFKVFNGELYFKADAGNSSDEGQLWKTDGTTGGTVMVKNIYPAANAAIDHLHVFNNSLYFTAQDGTNGYELWKSDGTTAGTMLFKDINPGSGGSYGETFTTFNGKFYFSAEDGTHGNDLWVSDGTPAGTMLFKDINAGSGDSYPGRFTVFGSKMYFQADGPNLSQVWMTDGTVVGTMEIFPVGGDTDALGCNNGFGVYGSSLYFNADYFTDDCEVWKLDTIATTTGLTELNAKNELVTISPNPSDGIFNLELTDYKNVQVEIYNNFGQQILSASTVNQSTPIDLTKYTSGIYNVRILRNNELISQTKLVKKD
jgi:ELWxxDGT repeat protein